MGYSQMIQMIEMTENSLTLVYGLPFIFGLPFKDNKKLIERVGG